MLPNYRDLTSFLFLFIFIIVTSKNGKSPQKNSSNSQDFDLDEIDKFTKKTYFQGFQDQTETKKNILGYLNKNQ